jgi:hypothetical protein
MKDENEKRPQRTKDNGIISQDIKHEREECYKHSPSCYLCNL